MLFYLKLPKIQDFQDVQELLQIVLIFVFKLLLI
jgi:hypothetical protein